MILLSTYQTLPNLAFCLSSNKRINMKLTGLWTRFSAQCQAPQTFKNLSSGDSNVNARASMKSSTNLSTNYECETSPKHKIFHKI